MPELLKAIHEKLYEPEFLDLTVVDFAELAQGCRTYDEFKLETNLSAVVNTMIKQIIFTESIPFEIKINHPVYSKEEAVKEVEATLAFEGMELTEEEIRMLYDYKTGNVSGDELRKKILDEVI